MNNPLSLFRFYLPLIVMALLISPGSLIAKSGPPALPPGFVYLRDIAPTILQDMRYATRNNFTGQILPGYQASECILRMQVAQALLKVQTALEVQGVGLKVYDCYRPHRAVRAFVRWASNKSQRSTKDYYPRIAKSSLFKRGYIARRSAHSRGSAIDLTLVALPAIDQPAFDVSIKRGSCNDRQRKRRDNSLDMGTAFDCFDVMSHTDNRAITGPARANRLRLRKMMSRFGFANYHKEWWHYSYKRRKYPRTSHDFVIRSQQLQK